MAFQLQKRLIQMLVFSLLMRNGLHDTTRVPNACLTVWMFGLPNASKEQGADAVKFLLYYDVDSSDELNQEKQAYHRTHRFRGVAEDIPFFLEILAYDEKKSLTLAPLLEYAKSKTTQGYRCYVGLLRPRFLHDVFESEVPVNIKYVEGFGDE